MAVTSRRIAGRSEVITGRRDSEEALRFRERATDYEAQSKELQQEYRDLATERAARAADPQERQQQEAQVPNSQSAQPAENSATKEAEARDPELPKGELTDAKAESIAKIREQGRQIESAEKVRQNDQSRDRGGRSLLAHSSIRTPSGLRSTTHKRRPLPRCHRRQFTSGVNEQSRAFERGKVRHQQAS